MKNLIEATLDEVLPKAGERPAILSEAMRYAVGTGGKRIRPLICLASSVAVGGTADDAKYPAAAIELLHNYTLIHDDLPAMDNDRERRGQPSVWAKFGEANAILAGDALLALACRVAARASRNVAAIIDELGDGGVGVVRGQVEDIALAEAAVPSRPDANRHFDLQPSPDDFVYRHKTSDLFIAAAVMGGLAGGGTSADCAVLRDFALNLGLAFQYEDDLLDGDGIYPPERTRRLVNETTDAAVAALDALPSDASLLRDIARQLVGRSR